MTIKLYTIFSILLLVFGAVIMSLEILASNLMSPYFGGSVYTWGSIISSFMVHLSIGYVLGGHYSKRTSSILPLIILLITASVWIILIPQIHPSVCEFISEKITDVRLGSLSATNIIFFIPITIMAMVSPYVIGLISEYDNKSSFTAGIVLSISTLGSFVGTNITAFYLIDMFPISRIVTGLGLICLVLSVGISLLRISRK